MEFVLKFKFPEFLSFILHLTFPSFFHPKTSFHVSAYFDVLYDFTQFCELNFALFGSFDPIKIYFQAFKFI